MHQQYLDAPEYMTPGHPAILCEKDVKNIATILGKRSTAHSTTKVLENTET